MTLNDRLPRKQQYLAHEMNKVGYQTAVIGKWHLRDLPTAFDYYKVLQGKENILNLNSLKRVKNKFTVEGHSTDCIMDSALHWFENIRSKDLILLKVAL